MRAAVGAHNMERMVHCLEAGPSNSSFPVSPHSGLEQEQKPSMALWASSATSVIGLSVDGVENLEQEGRESPGALPRLVLRGLVARLSHLPKSETECDVTPPGDAEPRSSIDDDNAEKLAANR